MSARSRQLSPVVESGTVPVRIVAPPATEPLRHLGFGRSCWWLRAESADRHDPAAFHSLSAGRPIRGWTPLDVTVRLAIDTAYVLGTGVSTRHRFAVTEALATVTIGIDGSVTFTDDEPGDVVPFAPRAAVLSTLGPAGESSFVVTGSAPPADREGTPADPWHVRGAPEGSAPFGVTYDGGSAAFDALSLLVQRGGVATTDVAVGRVAVARGRWPDSGIVTHTRALGTVTITDTETGTTETSPIVPLSTAIPTLGRPVDRHPVDQPDHGRAPAPSLTFDRASVSWSDQRVDSATRERAAADRAYLDSLGFATAPTAVREGAVLSEYGQQRLIESYRDWADQPRAVDSLSKVAFEIAGECRSDLHREGRFELTDDGGLITARGLAPIRIERQAIGDLVARCGAFPRGAGAVFREAWPATRAALWRQFSAPTDRLVLRTRLAGDGADRAVFAVVSPGYTRCDADLVADVARQALQRIPGGELARGPVEYDPETASLSVDALFHVNHCNNFGAGDIFKMGARISTNDAGNGAIRVSFGYWRNLCLNLGILDVQDMPAVRIVHRGTQAVMIAKVAEGIRTVLGYARPFVERWTGLRAKPASTLLANPSASTTLNIRAILSGIAGADMSDLPELLDGAIPEGVSLDGMARDVAVERLLAAWQHEPGDTLADVVNAVTRIHSERVPIPVLRSAERVSSALIGAWT